MKLKYKYFSLLIVAFLVSCQEEDKTAQEIAKIPISFEVQRFDLEFSQASEETIPKLKSKYPFLFPAQYPDSIWAAKLKDTIQQELLSEVHKEFADFSQEKKDLHSLFQHITFYFPNFSLPKVVTLTTDVQYDNRVVLTDSLLLLGLDNYLGKDHHFYRSISKYIAKRLSKTYLVSDVASAFAKKINYYPRNRTFLSRMVYYGKELYLKDILMPNASDAQKMGFEQEEMDWAFDNEEQMWRYFVERELLFSTDSELDRRFLDPAPFSKFQLELDSESPGGLGRFIGWQIVRAFMEKNPKVSVVDLLDLSADEIFKKSNYKPKK